MEFAFRSVPESVDGFPAGITRASLRESGFAKASPSYRFKKRLIGSLEINLQKEHSIVKVVPGSNVVFFSGTR